MEPEVGRKLLTQTFLKLEQPPDKVQCMHVYVDGTLRNFRTKDQTWPQKPRSPDEFPLLEFCGSATDFDVGNLADYYAKPVKLYKDPFRGGPNVLVFCETYSRERLPTFANNRYRLLKADSPKLETETTFTFYQSYTFLRKEDGKPLSYMDPAYDPDSKSGFACGRIVAESHYKACLYAGVNMASLEPVTGLGQWRYSVGGSSSPVEIGDDVWMSRFLLVRVAEDFGVAVNFEKEPAHSNLLLEVEDIAPEKKLRIVDALLSKFVIKEHRHIQIRNLQCKIIMSGYHGDIDPYDLCKKIIEAVATVS
ncbi:unnamed protein product [Larinioides sclopetarius]|uniref:Glutamine synthetase n=1 Tax=Larinioides sclopetarius TaxID=280406 RepID=A0AAV1Z5H4_9ARAC